MLYFQIQLVVCFRGHWSDGSRVKRAAAFEEAARQFFEARENSGEFSELRYLFTLFASSSLSNDEQCSITGTLNESSGVLMNGLPAAFVF